MAKVLHAITLIRKLSALILSADLKKNLNKENNTMTKTQILKNIKNNSDGFTFF